MDGQVLGGGVIVLVAALLWLVYLVPTWQARHRYNAAERNAVRLNQALRILAETSETPDEVRLELNARTAHQQQRLAKRVQAEREASQLEELRSSLEQARQAPTARRARARRRARLIATVLLVGGLALVGTGIWQIVQGASQVMLWSGTALALLALGVLQRMAKVQVRAAMRDARIVETAAAVERPAAEVQDLSLPGDGRTAWTPRPLPRPLAGAAGSRATAQLGVAEAHESLRRAAREEAMRARAEQLRPEPVRITVPAERPAASAYSRMGVVDDAEIEAHVRDLLARRAVGQ